MMSQKGGAAHGRSQEQESHAAFWNTTRKRLQNVFGTTRSSRKGKTKLFKSDFRYKADKNITIHVLER